jgi:hypothetical protein
MENNSVGTSLEEMQKFYELVDKVAPCTVFAEEENLEKIKKWLGSDRSKKYTFVEIPKSFNNQIGDNNVFLISMIDKPIKVLFEDKKYE